MTRETTGATITIITDGTKRNFVIRGNAKTARDAKSMILMKLADYRALQNPLRDGEIEDFVEVPSGRAGAVIGKNGTVVRRIMNQTFTRIERPPKLGPSKFKV